MSNERLKILEAKENYGPECKPDKKKGCSQDRKQRCTDESDLDCSIDSQFWAKKWFGIATILFGNIQRYRRHAESP